jgi:hypothetical protein
MNCCGNENHETHRRSHRGRHDYLNEPPRSHFGASGKPGTANLIAGSDVLILMPGFLR